MVFFGENGLTSTSANHVANLAKEFAQNYEGKLSDFNFYSTNIGLIGNSDSSRTSVGLTPAQLQEIPDILEKVAQANSLISWLREAIKARESELETIRKKDISEWCEENGIKYWESPSRPDTYTRDEAIASLNIKERNRIYELQAKCSVIGKFIHPDGRYSNARKRLLKVLGAPYDVRGEGRDALVYSYKPTCEEHDVNEMFFMSSAHSYLVLLNMKDHEKARKVREQLMEMGISQKDLDRSTRGTIGNVSSKKTKVDLLSSQQSKPIPGRRLKRQIKHKN